MLTLENVQIAVAGKPLLSGVNLSIREGDRLGLVGKNGAGKSTLLHCMAGETTPDGGKVRSIKGLTIGALWQEPPAEGDVTVLDMVLSGNTALVKLEAELRDLETQMADPGNAERIEELAMRYGELHDRMDVLGGYTRDADALKVLAGLGFSEKEVRRPCGSFSGGWRMRVSLARLLVSRPQLLFMDEPTNHLDVFAVEWLEGFLSAYPGGVLVVSHDREFLNNVINRIAAVIDGGVRVFPGNYDNYVRQREVEREVEEGRARNQQREQERMQAFVDRFRAKATKARQAGSRAKMLERMKKDQVQVSKAERTVDFRFPATENSAREVVVAKDLAKHFDDNRVFSGFSTTLYRGERVAIVGPNGVGKTTLLKLLAGVEQWDEGSLTLGHKVTRAYFAQHTLETLAPVHSAYESVQEVAPTDPVARIRGILGRFLITGDDQLKKVEVLSGGEKARVALARLLIRPANFLLMDEPTNHLDIPSRDVLEEALTAYDGTLVLITHDRHLIRRVANRILEIKDGRLEDFPGSYDDYLSRRESPVPEPQAEKGAAPKPKGNRAKGGKAKPTAPEAKPPEARAGLSDKERRRQKARVKEIESALETHEPELATLSERLADPDLYGDTGEFDRVLLAHTDLAARVARLTAEWERLSEQLEA